MGKEFSHHNQVIPDFDKDDLAKVKRLAGLGLSQKKIAHVFGIHFRTFEERMKKDERIRMAYDQGVAEATVEVANKAYEMATDGKNPAMTMFWLKCKDNWKETQKHELTTKVTIEDLVNGASQKAMEARDVTPLEEAKKDQDE